MSTLVSMSPTRGPTSSCICRQPTVLFSTWIPLHMIADINSTSSSLAMTRLLTHWSSTRLRCRITHSSSACCHPLQPSVSMRNDVSSVAVSDVDEWFAMYDQLMRALMDKHAPQMSIRAIRRQCAPWYNEECRAAKVKRKKAEKRFRLRGSADNLAKWRRQSQAVRSLFQPKYSAYSS